MQTLEALQRLYEREGITFTEEDNALIKLRVHNSAAEAEIYLHGALVSHFQPKNEAALIFDATKTELQPPKTVHAGIPLCWPWFGAHPTDTHKPQHGFARDSIWELREIISETSGETTVILTLHNDDSRERLFAYAFELTLTVTVAKSLTLSLRTTNLDKESFTLTQALHTYLAVDDVQRVIIKGLERTSYVDYTDEKRKKVASTPLMLEGETNRVYLPTTSSCSLIDPQLGRIITVEKHGSDSTTIWNPWKENRIHDLQGQRYRKFVCIETTNALEDARTLQPGESTTITQKLSAERL